MLTTILAVAIGSAAITEILWTAFGLSGLILTLLNWRDARRDQIALRVSGRNGDMAIVARTAVYSEVLRLVQMSAVTGVGVWTMAIPPANPAQPVTPTTAIVTLGLFIITAVVVFQSILGRFVRHQLYDDDFGEEV